MLIDIFNIAPNIIKKNLQGKFVCFYGPPKTWALNLIIK